MAAQPAPVFAPPAFPSPQALLNPETLWTRYGALAIEGVLNVAAAILILLGGLWFAGRVACTVRRLALKSDRIDQTLAAFLSQLARYAIVIFVLLAVLHRFGVETTSIVAVIGAATLAIGLALQGTLSNVAAGVMLVAFRPYRLGDFVEVAGEKGLVDDVGLFATTLTTLDGVRITLPNGLCWGAPIHNLSVLPRRRAEMTFSVSYDTTLDLAIGVLHRVIAADDRILVDPAPIVRVANLGDFSVDIKAYFWVANQDLFLTRLDVLKAVKEAFDAAGVTIPFPTSYNYEVRLPTPQPRLDAGERAPEPASPASTLGESEQE